MKVFYKTDTGEIICIVKDYSLPCPETGEGISVREIEDDENVSLMHKWDGSNFSLNEEKLPVSLKLTTDAEDTYAPFNGIPDIPAESGVCLIEIQKRRNNEDLNEGSDNLYLETNFGRLSTQSINLVDGKASFNFRAGMDTVVSEIKAYDPENPELSGSIKIQIRP